MQATVGSGRSTSDSPLHRVVVVGGGFGGLQAVRGLRRHRVAVTLIDRRSFHLFQPLVYQVATGMLGPGEIAATLRALFKRYPNVDVLLGEVTGFDLARRRVLVDGLPNGADGWTVPYDSLIVATGSEYTYFGHEEWREHAPDVKSPENALEVRRRILTAFEAAEVEPDPGLQAAWLTFVVVGAGPTGVELAGQIAEMARHSLRSEFRRIDTRDARIMLVEMADRVLPAFPPRLSEKASAALSMLGVTPLVGHRVVGIDEEGVRIAHGADEPEEVPAHTTVWAAGIVASDLATVLAKDAGSEPRQGGRVGVGADLSLPGHPEVMAIGDMAQVHDADGRPVSLPALAPVAIQQGRHASGVILHRLRGDTPPAFRYKDKGNLATIGRAKAVADLKGLQLSGLPAWLAWLVVHLLYLIGMQNRLLVLIRWAFSYLTRAEGARLITGTARDARRASTTELKADRR